MMVFAISSFAFAANSSLPVKAESQVALVKSYNKIKLYYVSDESGTVKVRIIDQKGILLGEFKVFKTEGFYRSINMSGLKSGIYTFEIEDANGTIIEKVNYNKEELIPLKTSIYKLKDQGKYSLQVVNKTGTPVEVKIYDMNGTVLFVEKHDKSFTRKYDLSQLDGEATFSVKSDIYSAYHVVEH